MVCTTCTRKERPMAPCLCFVCVCVCAHVCACASAHVCGMCVCVCVGVACLCCISMYVCMPVLVLSVTASCLISSIHPSIPSCIRPFTDPAIWPASQPRSLSICLSNMSVYLPIYLSLPQCGTILLCSVLLERVRCRLRIAVVGGN